MSQVTGCLLTNLITSRSVSFINERPIVDQDLKKCTTNLKFQVLNIIGFSFLLIELNERASVAQSHRVPQCTWRSGSNIATFNLIQITKVLIRFHNCLGEIRQRPVFSVMNQMKPSTFCHAHKAKKLLNHFSDVSKNKF